MKNVFEFVGLGVPFYLAAGTYGFFYWLDRNSSAQAKRAISAWLKAQPYRQLDLKAAVIAAFDHIHSPNLLSFRGFIRSAQVSTILLIGSLALRFIVSSHERSDVLTTTKISKIGGGMYDVIWMLACYVIVFTTCDYLSLIIVRKYLSSARAQPLLSVVRVIETTGWVN